MSDPVPKADGKNYGVEQRWPAELLTNGYTPISVFFLDHYSQLKPPMTHGEAMFIVHLMRYKWTKDAPHPGFTALAKQMGISPQMTRAHARSIEGKGYLLREMQEGTTNKFHLEPLFEALKKLRKQAQIKAGEQPAEPMASSVG